VITLGQSRCAGGPEAGAASELVEWTIWVDKETFLILKSVQEVDGVVAATTTVTNVQYNAPIEASRFDFTPPPDARVRDQRH
jgi:outer membrane lipoprotein-sorting protein